MSFFSAPLWCFSCLDSGVGLDFLPCYCFRSWTEVFCENCLDLWCFCCCGEMSRLSSKNCNFKQYLTTFLMSLQTRQRSYFFQIKVQKYIWRIFLLGKILISASTRGWCKIITGAQWIFAAIFVVLVVLENTKRSIHKSYSVHNKQMFAFFKQLQIRN